MIKKALWISLLLLLLTTPALAQVRYPSGLTRAVEEIHFPKQTFRYTQTLSNTLIRYFQQFPNLKYVDMYEVRVSNKLMGDLAKALPDVEFGFWFVLRGKKYNSNMKYFSTLNSTSSERYDEEIFSVLGACKRLEILDLGHNIISDISFVGSLKRLKILILSDNRVRDLSPVENLKELEYFEAFRCQYKDISPLGKLPKLLDVNITMNPVEDLTPLYGHNNLERLWLSPTKGIDKEEIVQSLPNVLIHYTSTMPTGDGWREHERYFAYTDLLKNYNTLSQLQIDALEIK